LPVSLPTGGSSPWSAISSDVLSRDDWATLHAVNDILQPFWKVSLRLQGQAADGSYGAIWEVLPSMDYLIDGLRGASHVCINNALAKLEEYSQILNDSPAYAASVVTNPAIKESYLRCHQSNGSL
jgi:hypothetical protein